MFMTKSEIQEKAPAIMSTKASDKMSERYIFTPTSELIDSFASVGWYPTKVTQQKNKKAPDFAKHTIRFASEETSNMLVGQQRPEIAIFNSHNGSSPLSAQLGIFRLVCSNGMVIASTDFGKMKWRHMKMDYNNVKQIVCNAVEEFGALNKKIDIYRGLVLDRSQQLAFAEKTIQMVWNGSIFEPEKLLKVRRSEDAEPTLYNTFNILQESIIKGGVTYSHNNSDITMQIEARKHKRSTTRPIKNIDRDLVINMGLWQMMDEFSKTRHF